MFRFNNGDRVRDRISGFTGIVTGRTDFLNGCIRYAVTPEKVKTGQTHEPTWFDEQQLELKKAGAIKVVPLRAGGPRPDAPRLADPR